MDYIHRKFSRSRSRGEDDTDQRNHQSRKEEYEQQEEDFITSNESEDEMMITMAPEKSRSDAPARGEVDGHLESEDSDEPDKKEEFARQGAKPKKLRRGSRKDEAYLTLLHKLNRLEEREKQRSEINNSITEEAIRKFEKFNLDIAQLKEHLDMEETPNQNTAWIKPPKLEDNDSIDYISYLRNISKYEILFKAVPTFSGDGKQVRDFLQKLNIIVNDRKLKLTPDIFKAIFLGKLSVDCRNNILGGQEESDIPIDELYRALIATYDTAESCDEAAVKLFQLKRGQAPAETYDSFLKEAYRLLSLSNSENKPKDMYVILTHILPHRIKEMFVDLVQKKLRSTGSKIYPTIAKMLGYLQPHRSAIEHAFSTDFNKSKPKIREIRNETPKEEREQTAPKRWCEYCKSNTHDTNICYSKNRPKKWCEYCRNSTHDTDSCYRIKSRTQVCERCQQSGHSAASCRARCRLCYAPEHLSAKCTAYPNTIPGQKECKYCKKFNLNLYHPESACQIQKAMSKN